MIDRSIIPEIETIHKLNPFTPNKVLLDNNTPCFFIEGPKEPVVKINLVLNAGAKYGSPYIAKLVNGLLAEGSQKYPGNVLVEELDKYGAYLFSSVNNDFATVTIVTQTQYLSDVLPVFFDAAYSPQIKEDILNAQCKRSHSALVEAYMQNGALSDAEFMPMVFGSNHFYGRVSHPENYQNVKRDDVVRFHSEFYNSNNAFLMVVGDITEDVKNTVVSIANQHMHFGKVAQFPKIIDSSPSDKRIILNNPYTQQASVTMGLESIGKKSDDYISLKIAVILLGGFFGSRLMQNVREKSGYTYGIYASLISFQQTGLLKISSDVKGDKAFEVEQQILDNIIDLQKNKVSTMELQRLKNYISGDLLNSFDGLFALDSAFLSTYMYGLKLDFFTRFADIINDFTADKLMEMMNKYIELDKLSTVIVTQQ